jgi:hypothetical protein
MNFMDAVINQSKRRLFPAYKILDEAQRTWDVADPPYKKIRSHRKSALGLGLKYSPQDIANVFKTETTPAGVPTAWLPALKETLNELNAARKMKQKADAKLQAERQIQMAEEDNIARAIAEKTMFECGCCVSEFPLNRMIHCENDEDIHWFCRACARTMAEHEIGNQKYKLQCMSMDGCEAEFAKDQMRVFLDEKAMIALGRLHPLEKLISLWLCFTERMSTWLTTAVVCFTSSILQQVCGALITYTSLTIIQSEINYRMSYDRLELRTSRAAHSVPLLQNIRPWKKIENSAAKWRTAKKSAAEYVGLNLIFRKRAQRTKRTMV